MGVKLSGFDDFNNFLNNLQKKAENLSGEIKFDELFNDSFMNDNTKFDTIDKFFDNSPFEIKTQEDFDNLDESQLDIYVNENSVFSTWEEMKKTAGALYAKKELGL